MQIGKFRSPPLNVLAEDTLPSGAELQRMQRLLVHEASSEVGPKPPPTSPHANAHHGARPSFPTGRAETASHEARAC